MLVGRKVQQTLQTCSGDGSRSPFLSSEVQHEVHIVMQNVIMDSLEVQEELCLA